ncbi:hypothetical protein ACOMHN_063774 [Nucella lapillus]
MRFTTPANQMLHQLHNPVRCVKPRGRKLRKRHAHVHCPPYSFSSHRSQNTPILKNPKNGFDETESNPIALKSVKKKKAKKTSGRCPTRNNIRRSGE